MVELGARRYKLALRGRFVDDPPETRILASWDGLEPSRITDNRVDWDNFWCADYHGYLHDAVLEFPELGKRLVFGIDFGGPFVTGSEFSIQLGILICEDGTATWEDIE